MAVFLLIFIYICFVVFLRIDIINYLFEWWNISLLLHFMKKFDFKQGWGPDGKIYEGTVGDQCLVESFYFESWFLIILLNNPKLTQLKAKWTKWFWFKLPSASFMLTVLLFCWRQGVFLVVFIIIIIIYLFIHFSFIFLSFFFFLLQQILFFLFERIFYAFTGFVMDCHSSFILRCFLSLCHFWQVSCLHEA